MLLTSKMSDFGHRRMQTGCFSKEDHRGDILGS